MSKATNPVERLTEIISLLRPESPRKLPESFTAAAIAGDIRGMQAFLDRGADINERSVGFGSPLGAACAVGALESAKWLIAHGALLDPPGVQTTPIQSALGKANCEAAALLLDAGLPVERAAWGVIAAAMLGRADMLRWLLGRGLSLDQTVPGVGMLRERALHNAKKEGGEEVLRILRGESEAGPAPATPPAAPALAGREPPRARPEERDALLAEALGLVRAGGRAAAKWNATGPCAPRQRQRILSFAAGNGLAGIVGALLDAGAAPDVEPDGTPPPLTAAAAEAQVEVMTLLLERGALPDGQDGKSWLPLASAAQSGEPEAVRVLLEAGANPKARPAGGQKLADHARGPYVAEIRGMLDTAASTKGKGGKAAPAKARKA